LAFHSWNATVKGLDTVPGSDRPPVNDVRFAFQTMVGIGTLMALLGVVFIVVRLRRKRLPESRWFYAAVAIAGPASVTALWAGWVVTEVGRQPWVVYKVMTTTQAVTTASSVPVSYGVLVAAYVLVGAAAVWILRRLARMDLTPLAPADRSSIARTGEAAA
jgi:cytochrome bd ubiquinol oxidase subunit I